MGINLEKILKTLSRRKIIAAMRLLERNSPVKASDARNIIGDRAAFSHVMNKLWDYGFVEREILQEKYPYAVWQLTEEGKFWCSVLHRLDELEKHEIKHAPEGKVKR